MKDKYNRMANKFPKLFSVYYKISILWKLKKWDLKMFLQTQESRLTQTCQSRQSAEILQGMLLLTALILSHHDASQRRSKQILSGTRIRQTVSAPENVGHRFTRTSTLSSMNSNITESSSQSTYMTAASSHSALPELEDWTQGVWFLSGTHEAINQHPEHMASGYVPLSVADVRRHSEVNESSAPTSTSS